MSRTVLLEDDGEFATVVRLAGVAHPPGYPLYILLAHPFTWLPIGSIAFRVHLASAVFGAGACAALWWVARTLVPSALAAYVGALAFGLSRVFWSQAVIADVYTLNALVFFVLLGACLDYVRRRRAGTLITIGLLGGLGLGNHWPLLIFAAPALLLTLAPVARPLAADLVRIWPWILVAFAVGLSPYLWMVVRSQVAPDLAFYGAIESWADFWFYVSRGGYSGADASPSAGWWDKGQLAAFLGRELLAQFTIAGALLAALGAWAQWRTWGVALGAGLSATVALGSVGLAALIGADYEFLTCAVVRVFPLIPYGIMALWLALGFDRVATVVRAHWGRGGEATAWLAAVAVVTYVAASNFVYNDQRNYRFTRDYALTVLNSLEPGAVVFTHGDVATHVLGYFHFAEGVRPDVKLFDDQGLGVALDGRLFRPTSLDTAEKTREIVRFVRGTNAPVYFFGKPPDELSDIDVGVAFRIDRSRENSRGYDVDDRFLDLIRRVEADPRHTDPWTIAARDAMIGRMATALTAVVELSPGNERAERLRADLERVSGNYYGLVNRIGVLEHNRAAEPERLLAMTERAEALVDDTIGKEARASVFLLRGRILARQRRLDDAIIAYERSIEIFRHPTNPALNEIKWVRREREQRKSPPGE
jgi:hypothetical protein